jgi:hypothetical protein
MTTIAVDYLDMMEQTAMPPLTSAPVFTTTSKKRTGKTLFRILSKPFTSKKSLGSNNDEGRSEV